MIFICADSPRRMNDFADFGKLSVAGRNKKVDDLHAEFGMTNLVSFWNYPYGISDSAKAAKRKSVLKEF